MYSKKLALLLIPALAACAKSESPNGGAAATNPNGSDTPRAESPAKPDAPILGASLCGERAKPCSTFLLKLAPHSVAAGLQGGKVLNEIVNKALPNVISASYGAEGLVLKATLPVSSKREEIELEIPKDAETNEYALETDEKMIISAFNESSGEDLYAFAQKSKSSSSKRRVKITFVKISNADKKAAGTKESRQVPVSLSKPMGSSSVRGSEQEVEIAQSRVLLSDLSASEVQEIKSNREMKKKYPDSEWFAFVTVYFQDGKIKPGPRSQDSYGRINEAKDYCFVEALVEPSASNADSITVGGVVTLVTGAQQFGPVDGSGKPAEGFEQEITSGFQNTGAASYVIPGKGYNKFGNGRRDSKQLIALGCTSKNIAPITVNTIVQALGERRVDVTYPRANIVESYLDDQNGVDLDLGMIAYRWKRLERLEGATVTILKDIESPNEKASNAVFQGGRPVAEIDFNGGSTCYVPNHLKAGTKFKLSQAWPNTVRLNANPPVSNGAVFTTDNPAIERVTVNVIADWMTAPSKITANPALLDAKALEDCFGAYVSISK